MKKLCSALVLLLAAHPVLAQPTPPAPPEPPRHHHHIVVTPDVRIDVDSDGDDAHDNDDGEDDDRDQARENHDEQQEQRRALREGLREGMEGAREGLNALQGLSALQHLPDLIMGHHAHGGSGRVVAQTQVQGPVTFRLAVLEADIEVRRSEKNQVSIEVEDSGASSVKLAMRGTDRLEAEFPTGRLLEGHVRLELPAGSSVDLSTLSGDLNVDDVGGDARLRSTSGDVVVRNARKVEVQSVEGDVTIEAAAGPVRVKTVSGDAQISSAAGPASQLEFESASGDLEWNGACGKDCHLDASSLSGGVALKLDEKSSFEVEFRSTSGSFEDNLHIARKDPGHKRRVGGEWVRGSYGAGEGLVEAESFSGDLELQRCDSGCGQASGRKVSSRPVPPIPPAPPAPPVRHP